MRHLFLAIVFVMGCGGGDPCSNGAQDGDETDVDCGGGTCGACMAGMGCRLGTDCQSGFCTNGKCVAPLCTDGVKNGKETDVDCGGLCPGCALGKMCKAAPDCTSLMCVNNVCTGNPCMDGTKNGAETDIDCGGGSCPKCSAGQMCLMATDCTSAQCNNNVCVAPLTCTDGMKDGDESDIDCGGSCMTCADGRACVVPGDCLSGTCTNGICGAAPDCMDQMKDGQETDVDCGGPQCAKCVVGKQCLAPSDCTTNKCINGKCTASGAFGFAPAVNWPTNVLPPGSVFVGHLNNDKAPDLVVSGVSKQVMGSALHVLLGKGDGSFPAVTGRELADSGMVLLVVADFNKDGKDDVVVGERSGKNLPYAPEFMPGDGAGSFGPPGVLIYGTLDGPYGTGIDWNGDGNLDFASWAGLVGQGTPAIYPGKGNGTFLPSGAGPEWATGQIVNLVGGDVDGDKVPDLIESIIDGQQKTGIIVSIGLGNGQFKMPTWHATDALGLVRAGDVNGDGKLDLVSFGSTATVHPGNGDGTYQNPVTTVTNRNDTPVYELADMDRDGKLDIVAAGTSNVAVLLGNGDGTFRAPVTFVAGKMPQWIAVADLNQDGKLDIAAYDNSDGTVNTLINTSP